MQKFILSSYLLLTIFAIRGAETEKSWPLWDGKESVAAYAARAGLAPAKNFDLGKGVTLEMVLIPAGRFVMGIPKPVKPTITIERAIAFLIAGGVLFLVLAIVVAVRRKRHGKFRFSLLWLLGMTAACGLLAGAGVTWYAAVQQESNYEAALKQNFWGGENHLPPKDVLILKPFYLGKFLITQEQYEAIVGLNPAWFRGARNPVERVTWFNALDFLRKTREFLSDHGQGLQDVRLPSEAQWEFACKSGTEMDFDIGNDLKAADKAGWFGGNSGNTTHPVGGKSANAFGLYDMHGNVRQWCSDLYDESLNKTVRVTRGGSWRDVWRDCAACSRNCNGAAIHQNYIGLRIVIEVP